MHRARIVAPTATVESLIAAQAQNESLADDADKDRPIVANTILNHSLSFRFRVRAGIVMGGVREQFAFMSKSPFAHIAPIEGLRALAVMAVLLFHLGVAPFGGGYVGVDIFFVISGYLMVRIIAADQECRRHSTARFLWRRFKRLAPAMVAMSGVVLFAAALVYMPQSYDAVAKSALAANSFVANLYFWQTTNYFERSADIAPFLHTWSLGVEAQFYLALALGVALLGFLGVTRITSRGVFTLFVLAALGSFGLDVVMTNYLGKVTGSFYFPLTRFWELLLGSVVALHCIRANDRSRTGPFLSWVGLALALSAVFILDENSVFPGLNALLPALGTAMVLRAADRQQTLPNRILSLNVFQFLGRVSYSLYLWHWPLIVIYRYAAAAPLALADQAILFAGSLVLAWLSYIWIEGPFRRNSWRLDPRKTAIVGATACAALAAMTLPIQSYRQERIETEFPRYARLMTEEYRDRVLKSYDLATCFVEHSGTARIDDRCLELGISGDTILLLGDSHAAHLRAGLRNSFPKARIAQANVTGCRALIDRNTAAGDICADLNRRLFADFLKHNRPDLIVLAGRWNNADLPSLKKTLHFLNAEGQKTVLVGPAIEYLDSLPSLLIRQGVQRPAEAHRVSAMLDDEVVALDARVRDLAVAQGVQYVSSMRALCLAGPCDVLTGGGTPFQWDYGHYTRQGSREFVRRIAPAIASALMRPDTRRAADGRSNWPLRGSL